MKKYLLLSERVGDEGIYERDIILEMKDGIVKESHITNFRYPDEDILKGKNSKELEVFAKGDKDSEWEIHELSEAQYRIEYEKNRVGRKRYADKNNNKDLLEEKEASLNRAEKMRPRKGDSRTKEQRRIDAYCNFLKRNRND